jgi:hypothetical protein
MPYIGNQPAEQFTSFATQEFSTSATTSYTLDHAVTNENEIALFINNVRQQPGSGKAYTATGTALTLSAATASTDTMYCVFLGRALQTVNPATNSITAAMVSANAITGAKLNTDVISAQTALTSEPADTDEFLVSDAGTLKRIDYSLIKATGGLAVADMWRITSNYQFGTGDNHISSNWEQIDTSGQNTVGSDMTESSGLFTFPSTGVWLISANVGFILNSSSRYIGVKIQGTFNGGSSYTNLAVRYTSINRVGSSNTYAAATTSTYINVGNTSNDKVRFLVESEDSSTNILGSTSQNESEFLFIKLN